jgi:hypothetical protein
MNRQRGLSPHFPIMVQRSLTEGTIALIEESKAAGEVAPPGTSLTGPASPRRSVCARQHTVEGERPQAGA